MFKIEAWVEMEQYTCTAFDFLPFQKFWTNTERYLTIDMYSNSVFAAPFLMDHVSMVL